MSFVRPAVLGLLAIAVDLICKPAYAQEGFPPPSPELIVWSARACYAEATWSLDDCSALLHVIRKRAQRARWPFLKMLKQYSVVNWVRTTRGKRASSFALERNREQGADWNEHWTRLVQHVKSVFADAVIDPCPEANHWAATWYVPRSPMRRVRCTLKLANAFWVSTRG